MRILAAIVTMALLAGPASAVLTPEVPTPAAHVTIEVFLAGLPGIDGIPYASCPVTVAPGADGGAALDAAVASGCLSSWGFTVDPSYGRFVDRIDDVQADTDTGFFLTYWEVQYNGEYSLVGIDDLRLAPGDTVGFKFTSPWIFVPVTP